MPMNKILFSSTPSAVFIAILGFFLISTANSLRANSWQKRIDRAFLQVDGVTSEGRFRSFQRALKDPELRTDVSKAIDVVREKGFGKGHPEFIETLWPEGTQARQDLEAINALTKQLSERSSEVKENASSSQGLLDIIKSTQENLRFGEEGSRAVVSSVVKQFQSDPNRAQRLAENFLRNSPVEVESPSYKLLGQYLDEAKVVSESDEGEETKTVKKTFLTVPPLELRQYDGFRSISVPVRASGASSLLDEIYTLKNMGSALTEIFSYLELGNNAGSTLIPMTTPFFISDTTSDDTNKMFVKLSRDQEDSPPKPVGSSRVAFDNFPETVMATLSFPGICTNEEIKRQKAKLMQRVEMIGDTGWAIKSEQIDSSKKEDTEDGKDAENKPEIYVLQYNAPGTLPWRRMNEIAVVMTKKESNLVNDKNEILAEVESESDQNDDKVIVDREEESESEADTDDDTDDDSDDDTDDDTDDNENTPLTDPDVV